MRASRRTLLKTLIAAPAALLATRPLWAENATPADDKGPTFAIDLETFWPKLPFEDRLKHLSDSGFTHYEFTRFKTKDIVKIAKAAKELDLTATQFTVYTGLTDAKRKDMFLASLDDALEVATLLEVKRLVVAAGELSKGVDREKQVDAVAEALTAAAEKVKETEITLLFDPFVKRGDKKGRVVAGVAEAVELLKDVNSQRVKLLVDFESGWPVDSPSAEWIREVSGSVGSFRMLDSRLGKSGKTAGLDALGLLKLLDELCPKIPIGVELAPKGDPAEVLGRVRQLAKEVKA